MVKKEIFICDYCQKSSSHLTQGSNLPYLHGWRFLEGFSYKSAEQFNHEVIRKHFCSVQCMLNFIASFIEGQEEQINNQKQKSSFESKENIVKSESNILPTPLLFRSDES